jgi:dihydroflavonol-4-reductase
VVTLPDFAERPLAWPVRLAERRGWHLGDDVSSASLAGTFLRLHVRGDRADAAFGLVHPPPEVSIFAALDDARRSGRAAWLPPIRTGSAAAP